MTDEALTAFDDAWRCRLDPVPFLHMTEEILGTASPFPLAAVFQPLARRHSEALARLTTATDAAPLVLEGLAVRLEQAEATGEALDAAARLTRSPGGATARLSLVTLGGEAVASADLHLMQTRPSRAAAMPGAPARQPPDGALPIWITAEQVVRYADISADRNPLHTDRQFCVGLGLPERVVHGSLLAMLAQAAAGAGGGTSLSMRFLKPCFVAEKLALVVIHKGPGGRVVVHGGDGAMAAVMDWKPLE